MHVDKEKHRAIARLTNAVKHKLVPQVWNVNFILWHFLFMHDMVCIMCSLHASAVASPCWCCLVM